MAHGDLGVLPGSRRCFGSPGFSVMIEGEMQTSDCYMHAYLG